MKASGRGAGGQRGERRERADSGLQRALRWGGACGLVLGLALRDRKSVV